MTRMALALSRRSADLGVRLNRGVSARATHLLTTPNACINRHFETIANPYGAYRNLVLEFNN